MRHSNILKVSVIALFVGLTACNSSTGTGDGADSSAVNSTGTSSGGGMNASTDSGTNGGSGKMQSDSMPHNMADSTSTMSDTSRRKSQ